MVAALASALGIDPLTGASLTAAPLTGTSMIHLANGQTPGTALTNTTAATPVVISSAAVELPMGTRRSGSAKKEEEGEYNPKRGSRVSEVCYCVCQAVSCNCLSAVDKLPYHTMQR